MGTERVDRRGSFYNFIVARKQRYLFLPFSASDANRQRGNKEKQDVTLGGRLARGDKRDGRGSRAEISPTRREKRELGAEDEEAHRRESF